MAEWRGAVDAVGLLIALLVLYAATRPMPAPKSKCRCMHYYEEHREPDSPEGYHGKITVMLKLDRRDCPIHPPGYWDDKSEFEKIQTHWARRWLN